MALFAPQVSATQPAFIYSTAYKTGEVTISFSLSSYNKDDDFSDVRYTIVDPNISSTWGNNSMILNGQNDSQNNIRSYKEAQNLTGSNGEFSFKISFNATDYEVLTQNQFYQVQLWLVKGNEVSEASQATLIRPIAAPSVEWITSSPTSLLTHLEGRLKGSELLKSCYCTWGAGEDEKSDAVFSSDGHYFAIPLNPLYVKEGGSYPFTLYYTTQYGYENYTDELQVTYSAPSSASGSQISIDYKINCGAGTTKIELKNLVKGTSYVLQRYNIDNNEEGYWQNVLKFVAKSTTEKVHDNTVESRTNYKYRVVWKNNQDNKYYAVTKDDSISVDFEDIFLNGENGMFVIRYNPNITGFKWVTQESIANTLGGQFPVVRVNGDTKYRQFNLSGTIFSEGLVTSTSTNGGAFSWNEEEPAFYSVGEDSYMKSSRHITDLERHARRRIMEFLTDRKVKLFRSYEEGNILVRLTNISFTPNKQLGRHIYDFSATLTEVDSCTLANLEKNNLTEKTYQGLSTSTSTDYGYIDATANYEGAVTIVSITS